MISILAVPTLAALYPSSPLSRRELGLLAGQAGLAGVAAPAFSAAPKLPCASRWIQAVRGLLPVLLAALTACPH